VPYLAGRFGIVDEMNVIPGAEARATAAVTFRRLYWDTALSWGDPVLRTLRDVAGIDHVLFGSDYPYLTVRAADRIEGDIGTLELLVVGGLPIWEPIAWHGPFVMNTRDEIVRALDDYRAGRMGIVPAGQLGHRHFA
jgi:hypothetical protein